VFEIEIPEPFWQDGWKNIVMCHICGLKSYAAQFFGDKLNDHHLSTTMSTHLIEILRVSDRYGFSAADMLCPKCGAKSDVTTGNKIINLMAGSPL